MTNREIARQIVTALNSNSLTVAIYPTHVESKDEFKRQAEQFAKDHLSIGFSNGSVALGVACSLEAESVPKLLSNLVVSIKYLLAQFPELTAFQSMPIQVQVLAIFTHGLVDQIQAGTVSNGKNQWIKKSIGFWSKELAPSLSPKSKIILYSCNAANPNLGMPPFAEVLRQQLCIYFLQHHNSEEICVDVWGHSNRAHTTANSRLVQFTGGSAISSCGEDFIKLHCEQLYQLEQDEAEKVGKELNATAKALLSKNCLNAIAQIYDARDCTGTLSPINTYIRTIPFLGNERVWQEVTGNHSIGYQGLPVTQDTRNRLVKGLTIFRERFRAKRQLLTGITI